MRKSPDIKISELDLDQIFSDDHEIAGSRIPWFRNQVIQAGGPTEDIDEILLKDNEITEYKTITCRRGQMIPAVLLCPKLWHWGGRGRVVDICTGIKCS